MKASIQEGRVELEGREHHHLSRVARVKSGDRARLFDEEGTDYLEEVKEVRSGSTRLRILEREAAVWPGLRVFLAQALPKPKSMGWLIKRNGCEAARLGEWVMRAEAAALCAASAVILMWNR